MKKTIEFLIRMIIILCLGLITLGLCRLLELIVLTPILSLSVVWIAVAFSIAAILIEVKK